MTQSDIIQAILKDSNYHLVLFTEDEIEALRGKIFTKITRGKETPFINCIVRNKDIQLKPEEIVRQLYAARLRNVDEITSATMHYSIRSFLPDLKITKILK